MKVKCTNCNTILKIAESKNTITPLLILCPKCQQKMRVNQPITPIGKIEMPMENISLTKGSNESVTTLNDVEKYLATPDGFWETFHKSLNASYSSWSQYRTLTKEQWTNACYPNLVPSLNLLFEYPVLKNEYPIAIAQGCILTNYRIIVNDATSGIHTVPLNKIIHYGWKEIGESAWDKRKVNYFEFQINDNKTIKFDWTSFDENLINSAIARSDVKELNEIQKKLLELSFFEAKNKFEIQDIFKIVMPPFKQELSSQPTQQSNQTFQTKPRNKFSIILKFSVAAVLFFGLFKFCDSIDWEKSTNNSGTYTASPTYNCTWCGKEYSHTGYFHVMNECVHPEKDNGYATQCSQKCCMDAWNSTH